MVIYNRSLSATEILDHYLGISLHKYNSSLRFHIGNVTLTAPTSNLAANSWSHIAGTYSSSNAELYIDGTNKSSVSSFSPVSNIGNNTYIGNDAFNRTGFNGSIDEVRAYNRSLTSAEIYAASHASDDSNIYKVIGNFTSQSFDANRIVTWQNIQWNDYLNNTYQKEFQSNEIDANTVLLMHFNNATGEYERPLNDTYNISAQNNLVLYMPFDASNTEITPNASTVLLLHFNNDSSLGENDTFFVDNSTYQFNNGTCDNNNGRCPIINTTDYKFGGAALSFDGINDMVNATTTGFSTSSGTLEAWIKPNNNNDGNNYTIISTPTEISNNESRLIMLLHFNNDSNSGENDSLVYDWTGNNHNGTFQGNTHYNLTNTRFGKSIDLDGSGDYVSVPDSSDWDFGTGDYAIEFWIYANHSEQPTSPQTYS